MIEPHCMHCGRPAPDGRAGLAIHSGGYVFMVACHACPERQPVAGETTHCLFCGEPTGGAGQLSAEFRGQPVEVMACLECFGRMLRDDPGMGWLGGLVRAVLDQAPELH